MNYDENTQDMFDEYNQTLVKLVEVLSNIVDQQIETNEVLVKALQEQKRVLLNG